MTGIFEALREFKEAIAKIHGSELTYRPLTSEDLTYTGPLASLDLFPQGLSYPGHFHQKITALEAKHGAARRRYTANILQALWNLADLSCGGIIKALYHNQKEITSTLNYLDSTQVPRVFDDQTYQAALELQKLLKEVSDEKTLAIIPNPFRESVKNSLVYLMKVLADRIAFYEANTPTAVSNSVLCIIKARDKLCGELIADNWKTTREEIKTTCEQNRDILSSFLKAPSLEDLKKRIIACSVQHKDGVDACKNYKNDLNDWYMQYQSLPQKIPASWFIIKLASSDLANDNSIIQEWQKLYQTPLQGEALGSLLAKFYVGEISDANAALNLLEDQIGLLEKYPNELAQWHLFKQSLAEEVTRLAEVAVPEFFSQYQQTKRLPYQHSDQQELRERLSDDDNSLSQLMDRINVYQQQLNDHKLQLQEQLAQWDDADAARLSETQKTHSDYTTAVSEAKQQLTARIERNNAQLEQVKQMSNDAHEQKNLIQDKIAKASSEVRAQQLSDAQQCVSSTYKTRRKAEIHLSEQNTAHRRFTEHHQRALSEADKRFNPLIEAKQRHLQLTEIKLAQLDSEIQTLTETIQARQEHLLSVKTGLNNFLTILRSDKGLYISEKIPESELRGLLELAESELIKRVYDHQQQGRQNYGLNLYNLQQYWSHYTTFFKTTDAEDDLFDLINCLVDKLESIEKELSANSQGMLSTTTENPAVSSAPASLRFLPARNLWTLHTELQQLITNKKEVNTPYQTTLSEKQALQQEKTQFIEPSRQSKELAEKRRQDSDYAHQLACGNHCQAQMALNILELEYALFDLTVNKDTQESLRLFNELKAKGPLDILGHFATLDSSSVMKAIDTSSIGRESLLNQLSTAIKNSLNTQKTNVCSPDNRKQGKHPQFNRFSG